jgi:crossover junction endodeoxyribonuclease RuvC
LSVPPATVEQTFVRAEVAVRVLGVDPGLTRCGVGVVDSRRPGEAVLVDVGVLRTPSDADIGLRLCALERGIEEWLDRHRPDAVAVERVFSQANVRTVMGTAQAGAVAIASAARRGLPVALHTPSEVKAAVTGSGRADKAQVTTMVTRLLRLDSRPSPADAADALALAICHLWRGAALARMAAAKAGAR